MDMCRVDQLRKLDIKTLIEMFDMCRFDELDYVDMMLYVYYVRIDLSRKLRKCIFRKFINALQDH